MTMKPGWDWVTDEMRNTELDQCVGNMTTAEILATPGIAEIFLEGLNNDLLEDMADRHCHCTTCGAEFNENDLCLQCDLGWEVEAIQELEDLLAEEAKLVKLVKLVKHDESYIIAGRLASIRLAGIAQRLKELGWTQEED